MYVCVVCSYACYIAVGILKTAIGVTAILPTAIAVAAMTAKKSIFLNTFGPFFKTICWFFYRERLFDYNGYLDK